MISLIAARTFMRLFHAFLFLGVEHDKGMIIGPVACGHGHADFPSYNVITTLRTSRCVTEMCNER
jgi:hypothetical protein